MKFIADFHIHSHFSIATSKSLNPENLEIWAARKGIRVIGTGDFTHPKWLEELKEKLEPCGEGLFRLRKEYSLEGFVPNTQMSKKDVRFILTAEISTIYKKNERVRKLHHLIFAPDFEAVEKIQTMLTKIGNITSDGRPILGIDSRDLLEIVLQASDSCFLVPAHIWTPWFSVLGSKSGFDTIEECYSDLAEYINAVETGLSSDPPMNWLCSMLDKYTLISNSDAHSPEKIGREANIFNTGLSYEEIITAMKEGTTDKFIGTIEFFPQEGKYHYDGHRKCGICWDPIKTRNNKNICPVCGKKVTVGVMNRVYQLADRTDVSEKEAKGNYYSLIPLKEILSEIEGAGPNSQKIAKRYRLLIEKIGPELEILLYAPLDVIEKKFGDIIAEAIRRMRRREVIIKEGYDGEYGKITLFEKNELRYIGSQESLFVFVESDEIESGQSINSFSNIKEYKQIVETEPNAGEEKDQDRSDEIECLRGLNDDQKRAVLHECGPALIIAGPGTGKTRVLANRIAYLISRDVRPENILAVTFTNRAAEEMKTRVDSLLKPKNSLASPHISTFHSFGYDLLREKFGKIIIIDRSDQEWILRKVVGLSQSETGTYVDKISRWKQSLKSIDEVPDSTEQDIFKKYKRFLENNNLFDLDDLIVKTIFMLKEDNRLLNEYRKKYLWIHVDEYQDINFAQYTLIRTLMPAENSNIFVIGDPNQSIYGFRGSDIRFIKSFKNDYPGAKLYSLKKSYRCSDTILQASHHVISGTNKEESFLKGIECGLRINISKHPTYKSEAEFVARTTERLMGGLRFFSMDSRITQGEEEHGIKSFSDFAVLFRVARQAEPLKKAFEDHSIPYRVIDTNPVFRNGKAASIIEAIRAVLYKENKFIIGHIQNRFNIEASDLKLSKELIYSRPVVDTIKALLDSYAPEIKDSIEIKELIVAAEDFGDDIEKFLKFISLGNRSDLYNPKAENVSLMTLHASKGLEFECVFIVGCEDGLLPFTLMPGRESDIDEEKRLLYVGMTRAKRYLFLSHSDNRFIYGTNLEMRRSPFIDQIELELLERPEIELKPKRKKDNQLKLF